MRHYIQKFFKQDKLNRKYLLESLFFLGWSRFLIRVFHFKKIASFLQAKQKSTRTSDNDDIKKIAAAIKTMSSHTFWKSNCLTQALTARFMLNRRGIKSVVYFGVVADEKDFLKAHAWVESNGMIVTGKKGMDSFKVIKKF